jgi:hypothetical protein
MINKIKDKQTGEVYEIGGGKTYYMHKIDIGWVEDAGLMYFNVITSSNTPFTMDTFVDYLKTNRYISGVRPMTMSVYGGGHQCTIAYSDRDEEYNEGDYITFNMYLDFDDYESGDYIEKMTFDLFKAEYTIDDAVTEL